MRASNPFVRKLWHATDRPGNPLNGATALGLLWGPSGSLKNSNRSSNNQRELGYGKIVGSVEDQYRFQLHGKTRNSRKRSRMSSQKSRSRVNVYDWWINWIIVGWTRLFILGIICRVYRFRTNLKNLISFHILLTSK